MLYTRISILKTWVAASYISSSSRSVFAKEEAVFSSCWKKKGNNISFRCPPPNGLLPSSKGCRTRKKEEEEMKKAVALIQKKEKKKKVDGSRAWSKTVLFWEKGRAAYYGLFCCIEKKIPPQRSSHDISKCSVRVYTYSKRAVNHNIRLQIHK